MRQSKMPRLVRHCLRLIARGVIAVSLALILFLVLATQVKHTSNAPKHTSQIDVIWNYANASLPAYFDLPAHRDDAEESFPDPTDRDPVYLTEPCATWNNLDDGRKQRLMWAANAEGWLNPCAWCHCNAETPSYEWAVNHMVYGWPDLGDALCIAPGGTIFDTMFNFTLREDWLATPDNTVMRWRK